MTLSVCRIWNATSALVRRQAQSCDLFRALKLEFRPLSTVATSEKNTEPEKKDGASERKRGWLSRLLPVRSEDAMRESHSSMLSQKDTVYELQVHSVKPEFMESYLNEFRVFMEMIALWQTGAELAGSWTVEIGDLDEALHLWRFKGGYTMLNEHKRILRTSENFIEFRRKRNMMLRYRMNQILLPFSFWSDIQPRVGKSIYELRSYCLKPGSMIEWGNNWAKGIKFRQTNNEAVAGFFSHIGELYNAHHLWAYESLQARQEVRDAMWSRPGWDDVVTNTVPLIRTMTTRILIPTPFSPLQ